MPREELMFQEPMSNQLLADRLCKEDFDVYSESWNSREKWEESGVEKKYGVPFEERPPALPWANFQAGWMAAAVAWGAIVMHVITHHSPYGTMDPITGDLVPGAENHPDWAHMPGVLAWGQLPTNARIHYVSWVTSLWDDPSQFSGSPPGLECPSEISLFGSIVTGQAPAGSVLGRLNVLASAAIQSGPGQRRWTGPELS